MKDINLPDATIIQLYKDTGFRVYSERTEDMVAIILPALDASAVEFAEVLKRVNTPPSVLCPDGEVIGQDDLAEKIDAIKRVLVRRINRNDGKISEQMNKGDFRGASYYRGKTASYEDVIELLGKPIMDIKQELGPEE